MKEKFPKEIITYCFNKNSKLFLLSLSNLQGWSLIEIKSEYIILNNKNLYFYNFLSLINTYNFFLISFLFGLYKNYFCFLKFKGVGYKLIKVGFNFSIKLGFSHRILFILKKKSKFQYINKQLLKIESRSLANMKNIIFTFQKIRKMNSYKKKGVFLKGSIIKIKISKKKSKV